MQGRIWTWEAGSFVSNVRRLRRTQRQKRNGNRRPQGDICFLGKGRECADRRAKVSALTIAVLYGAEKVQYMSTGLRGSHAHGCRQSRDEAERFVVMA